jgi:hypothetical protein
MYYVYVVEEFLTEFPYEMAHEMPTKVLTTGIM